MNFLITHAFWSRADSVTKVLVNLFVLGGAVAALVKFKVFNMLAYRYTSELVCRHHSLPDGHPDGNIVFEADYLVRNIGDRPINLATVTLQLCAATLDENNLLKPHPTQVLADRVCKVSDRDKPGLFRIEAGERSIFTLRCQLRHLEPVVFVHCQIAWPIRRIPWLSRKPAAPYVGMYVAQKNAIGKSEAAAT
jgi:hypothetical protein